MDSLGFAERARQLSLLQQGRTEPPCRFLPPRPVFAVKASGCPSTHLHPAIAAAPISARTASTPARQPAPRVLHRFRRQSTRPRPAPPAGSGRSEEHTSELQSRPHLVCRLLLEK